MNTRIMQTFALGALLAASSAFAGEAKLGSAINVADSVNIGANASVKHDGKKADETQDAAAKVQADAKAKGEQAEDKAEAAGAAGVEHAKEGGRKIKAGAKATTHGAHKVVKSTVGGVTGAVGGLTGSTEVDAEASAKAGDKKGDDKPSDQ